MTSLRRKLLASAVVPFVIGVSACGGGNGGNGGSNSASGSASPSASGSASSSGTGGSASSSASAQATPNAELDKVEVTYDGKAAPTFKFPATPYKTGAGYRVVKEGDGAEIVAENDVTADYAVINGKTGKEVESSFGKKAAPLSMAEGRLLPVIRQSLLGKKVGSQVLVSVPGSTFPQEAAQQLGVGAEDVVLFFFDTKSAKTALKSAEGDAVPPKDGLPTVTMGKTATDPATFSVPKGFATPKTTTVQPLIIGKGPKVTDGQTARFTYTGVTLAKPGTPFDYSGKQNPPYFESQVGTGAPLIAAWNKAIVGQPVGSRLLIIAPPAEAYAKSANNPLAKDTLIFVVDILDAN